MSGKVGDIVEIRTSIGIAYALCSHEHTEKPKFGCLIRVFEPLYKARPNNITEVVESDVLFTTFFPLRAALKQGVVDVVSNVAVPKRLTSFPIFRNGNINPASKRVHTWSFWDGLKEWRVGKLTPEQRSYPLLAVWTYPLLLERVESRWRPEDDPIWGGAA